MPLAIHLPPLHAATQVTVVIPARNESAVLPKTLTALAEQCGVAGEPLHVDLFDVVVLANNCTDDTARVARALNDVRGFPKIVVAEVELPASIAHAGTARRLVMESVARRYLKARKPLGIVASTDADTRVDRMWVASIIDEMQAADAVTGRIHMEREHLAGLKPATRLLYLRDQIYRRLVSELDAMLDPVPCDPLPRHGQHFGASFAVTAAAYMRAGGVPPNARHEDIAFYEALDRSDARVRHSMRVRVATSARLEARAEGGFATFLSGLDAREKLLVECPELTVLRLRTRPLLRRLWRGQGTTADHRRARIIYGASQSDWGELLRSDQPFGNNLWRIERFAARDWQRFLPVSIELALPSIRSLHATHRKLG